MEWYDPIHYFVNNNVTGYITDESEAIAAFNNWEECLNGALMS